MQFLAIWAFLSLWIAFSSAQVDPVPTSQNGAAIVVNDCSFTVYYKSVSNQSVLPSAIPAGGIYKETYRLNIVNGVLNNDGTVEGTLGGVSIKISSNQSIPNAADLDAAFDSSTILQFEYTYNPDKVPGLWYDLSNVNGYLNVSDGSWPFEMYGGVILEGSSSDCPTVTCPPNQRICSEAYTYWNDDFATKSCLNNNSLILTLCSTVSDPRGFEAALPTGVRQVLPTGATTTIGAGCPSR